MAGKNAESERPVYQNWRRLSKRKYSATESDIAQQLKHIKTKATQASYVTAAHAEQNMAQSNYNSTCSGYGMARPGAILEPYPSSGFNQPSEHSFPGTYPSWPAQRRYIGTNQPAHLMLPTGYPPQQTFSMPEYRPQQDRAFSALRPEQPQDSPIRSQNKDIDQRTPVKDVAIAQHQDINPHQNDYMAPRSINDTQHPGNVIVSRSILFTFRQGLDSLTAAMEATKQSAAAERCNLTMFANDHHIRMKYTGAAGGQTTASSDYNVPDGRQMLLESAEKFRRMENILGGEIQRLRDMKWIVSAQLGNTGAAP